MRRNITCIGAAGRECSQDVENFGPSLRGIRGQPKVEINAAAHARGSGDGSGSWRWTGRSRGNGAFSHSNQAIKSAFIRVQDTYKSFSNRCTHTHIYHRHIRLRRRSCSRVPTTRIFKQFEKKMMQGAVHCLRFTGLLLFPRNHSPPYPSR
jgi:hypothetical protein